MGAIEIRTEIPGPRSRAIMARLHQVVPRGIAIQAPVVAAFARGARLTDVDGNTYIDLSGGIGVLNAGHLPPPVVEAARDQLDRFIHTDFSVVPYESYVTLAEKLVKMAPVSPPAQAAFFNSGAEAVENACKFARAYRQNRGALIAFEGGFHGRTYLALSLTSKPRPYKEGLGPFAPEVYRVPYAYCYRCPFGLTYPGCELACTRALERVFSAHVSPDDTAAVVVEPVLGEGGFVVPPRGWLSRLAEICARHGVLLIVDEIQTGFGRTGKMFACEHEKVRPDLLALAKSIAAGFPLSAVVGRKEVMQAPGEGGIGGTYVGNPVALRAALAAVDFIQDQDLPARAREMGDFLMKRFQVLKERCLLIGDVRGLGAMVGVELVRDTATREPAPEITNFVLQEALRRGVIIPRCGLYGNVIRFLAPLVITREELEEAVSVLEEVLVLADRVRGHS